ncbi:hypothetical protein PRZ48_008918 [Zasmidium cellare]|uniref:Uncharacterized protein n=1 Tax=Zasmidium cellare TaxID=395010 RepID=A0ABR0EHX0_ZASCE|nr:hypothetical protein PRZ48_008918 [Zasmidium cellare]
MAYNATSNTILSTSTPAALTAPVTSLAPTPFSSIPGGDWGWHKLPQELLEMIFDFAGMPSELHIYVHKVETKRIGASSKHLKYAVEVVNKGKWRDMLRLQTIKEVDQCIIQPALAKKKITLKLDIVGPTERGGVWGYKHLSRPSVKDCVADWDKFLEKFPFRRMTTAAPYILRESISSLEDGDFDTDELHYLQLTYDQAPAEEQSNVISLPWAQKAALWRPAEFAGLDEEVAAAAHVAIEAKITSVTKPLFKRGLNVTHIACLKECLEAVPRTLSSKKFDIGCWQNGKLAARGMYEYDPDGPPNLRSAMPLEEVAWDEV